jgi:RNA polymerase sigma-70 factor (ECF subfamily)
MLLHRQPSPVTRLHRAVAMRYAKSPEAGLAELDEVSEALAGYHLYHATRAELLRATGQRDAAREADARALALTANPAEVEILRERLRWTS